MTRLMHYTISSIILYLAQCALHHLECHPRAHMYIKHLMPDKCACYKIIHTSLLPYYYCRIPQLYPLLCMLALGKKGRGLMTTVTDRRMPRGRAISALSLAVWWPKREKSHKVSHNMTQIASWLVVATVFIGLWTLISRQRRGAYRWDKNTSAETVELEPKVQGGGLIGEGGVTAVL